jgi:6-phosphogluconolactonase
MTGYAWVYIGSYTYTMPFVQGKAAGITVCRLDGASGTLTPVHSVSGVTNPSYLTVDPRHRHLYCVEEHAVGQREIGEVSAFRIDLATGMLTHLNRQASHGAEPAHISMDRTGRWVLVANYRSGSIAVLPVQADGSLGPATEIIQHTGQSVHPERQAGPHAHWISVDPANRFVLVADLGLDAIMTYRFDAEKGTLQRTARTETRGPAGSGPRHAVFRPDGRYVYLANELDSTVVSFQYDAAEGHLTPIQHLSTLPAGYTGASTIAAVRAAPNGRFVYVANRGQDSIAIFASDPTTGLLEYLGYEPTQGRTPRDFNIDPTGTFLFAANQDSDTIVTFHIDEQTGKLNATGQVVAIDTPVCIEFCPIE